MPPLFEPATVELLQSGCALLVATATPDGSPVANRGWGCTLLDVTATPARLRILVGTDDAAGVAHVAPGDRVAVTGTDVRTLRSAQMKGRIASIEPADAQDGEVLDRYVADFQTAVTETDGTPKALLDHLTPTGLVAWIVEVDELFDQTPGPGAGTQVGSEP